LNEPKEKKRDKKKKRREKREKERGTKEKTMTRPIFGFICDNREIFASQFFREVING